MARAGAVGTHGSTGQANGEEANRTSVMSAETGSRRMPRSSSRHDADHERFDIEPPHRFADGARYGVVLTLALALGACGTRGPVIELENPAELNDAARLRSALLESPDLDAAPIRLESTPDRVTLRGFVESESERSRVIATARELFGEREIVDRIELR